MIDDTFDEGFEGVVERGMGESDSLFEFALGCEFGGVGDEGDPFFVEELLSIGVDFPTLGGRVCFLEEPAVRPCKFDGSHGADDLFVFGFV